MYLINDTLRQHSTYMSVKTSAKPPGSVVENITELRRLRSASSNKFCTASGRLGTKVLEHCLQEKAGAE